MMSRMLPFFTSTTQPSEIITSTRQIMPGARSSADHMTSNSFLSVTSVIRIRGRNRLRRTRSMQARMVRALAAATPSHPRQFPALVAVAAWLLRDIVASTSVWRLIPRVAIRTDACLAAEQKKTLLPACCRVVMMPRIRKAAVCQPDAHSPPNSEALAACLVEMERLRIELAGEADDVVPAEGVAADVGGLADLAILEGEIGIGLRHDRRIIPEAGDRISRGLRRGGWRGRGPGVRSRVSWLVSQLASTWSPLSISSTSTLVMPTSGREPSTRFSSGVRRRRTASPGRTGFSQRTSSTPGEPCEAARPRKPSTSMRIMIAQV